MRGETVMDNLGEIIIYQTEDGLRKLDVRMENETVWFTQQQMAELFQTSSTSVSALILQALSECVLNGMLLRI